MSSSQSQDRIIVQAYNVVDLVLAVEKQVKQGYTFDLDTQENFPQTLGTLFYVPMVAETVKDSNKEPKQDEQPIVELSEEVTQKPQSQRGRKAKQ